MSIIDSRDAEIETLKRQLRILFHTKEGIAGLWEAACKERDELRAALRELVEALDYATISSWQSTAKWDKQLAAARALTEKEKKS